jgi:hypothetical protein
MKLCRLAGKLPLMELVIIVERSEVVQDRSISFTSQYGMPMEGERGKEGANAVGWGLQHLSLLLIFDF